ncbi:helix-turn-helix domain-containing protein [Microbacterium sp. 1P10UB]|uniref:TetR/AcrR family transcriptional regulator n=1 Tax=unclassified Microbacterium TaxID=2609290 RepID=UPI00399F164C
MTDVIVSSARRERTRRRLLDAAADVFAEDGLDATSVEAICERAGFTRGAFYSNFASKDELFLELATRVSNDKLSAVTARVRELDPEAVGSLRPAELVGRLLDVEHDSRKDVLLLSEIRTHALRDAALAAGYLSWQDAMITRVAEIVADVGRAGGLTFRLPAEAMARMLLETWETAASRAAMEGLDDEALCRVVSLRMQTLAEVLVG